jgi:hypothetical protein
MDEEQKKRQRFINDKRGVHYFCHHGRRSRRATTAKIAEFFGVAGLK